MEGSDKIIVRNLSEDDKLGLDLLSDFLANLIVHFRQYGISANSLVSISKGLLIVEGYESIVFDGAIEISTGESYKEGGSDFLSVRITSHNIILSHHGSVYDEVVGSDAFEEVLLTIFGEHKYHGDTLTQFETWNDAFFIHFPDQSLFTKDTINFH
jgi:hypothetical protein